MIALWRSAQAMKHLAATLLGLALAAIAVILVAGQKMVAIQGPGALQVVDGQTVWLGVNEELWILDHGGRRTARHGIAQLGLREAVSNIVRAPGGEVLLTSRGDLHWQVVGGKTVARVRTIHPQWPPEFRDEPLRAIHVAISPDWDIAVATGGGHAVLLFDGEGRYKGRSTPGTFYFTNGLWHGPDGWWTTDTNRAALHLLDTQTLAVKRSVRLAHATPGYSALGELIASQGDPLPGERELPLATVSRLGFLMEPGHAVDVFADGRQAVYNKEPLAQLRDMAWLTRQLLLVDGAGYRVLRFGPDRLALEPFGDAEVQGALQQMRADREFWATLSSRWGFLLAAALLLAGIAAHGRHRKLATQEVIAARPALHGVADKAGLRRLARQRLWIFGLPILLRLLGAVGGVALLLPWLVATFVGVPTKNPLLALHLLVLSVALPVLLVAMWQLWRHERITRDPRYEGTLNHKGVAWLQDHDDWDRVREDGETPRETLYLPGWKPHWLLVTSHRVLLFAASARERRLQQQWPRRAVLFAGPPQQAPGGRPFGLLRRLLLRTPNLALHFADGSKLALHCASGVTADRAAAVLMRGRAASALAQPEVRPRQRAARLRRRWHEVAAAFVLPGSGQWLQDRFVTGTVLFTAAVLLCLFGWGPVLWASSGPKMHVDVLSKANAVFLWLLFSLVAAADAFHFSLRQPRVARGAAKSP